MRFIARFGIDDIDFFRVIDVYNKDIKEHKIAKDNAFIETLSDKYSAAVWFERKLFDDFGIEAKGAFDKRALICNEYCDRNIHPMLKRVDLKTQMKETTYHPYKYEVVDGDAVFEVPVGPIHAGIIEPGHFHFSQAGEAILHLEVKHFYKYRAIEKSLEGKNAKEAKKIISRISGNESIAYQIAFFEILAKAGSVKIPLFLKKDFALLLELERIAHHLTDLGFIPNDAGFGAALAIGSKMAEDTRRVLEKITSHRFGFDSIDENIQIDYKTVLNFADKLEKEVKWFNKWIEDIPSVWDRFDTTGILTTRKAIRYSAVGVVARASGLKTDARDNDFYKEHGFVMQREKTGDVAARFKIRIKEILNSIQMIRNFAENNKREDFTLPSAKDGEYQSFVESSLGELFMFVKFKDKKIERFYVRDPSFINWQLLFNMMEGNIIADFPLINKSCDLSYAGNDL